MAEERFIDDDKDRKYKIRIGEDGEEELYIEENEEEEEQQPVFEYPEFGSDEEELLTPEQIAERDRQREEEEKIRLERIAARLDGARSAVDEGEFERAEHLLGLAESDGADDGEYYALKLRVLTRDFTFDGNGGQCASLAAAISEKLSAEQREELSRLASPLRERAAEAERETAAMHDEHELKKSGRRVILAQRKQKAFKVFVGLAVPFAVLLVLAISFSTVMFAREDGVFLIMTIVFAALAFAALVALLFAARGLWDAGRNVSLNERDDSTELGRSYLAASRGLGYMRAILGAIDGDDISR